MAILPVIGSTMDSITSMFGLRDAPKSGASTNHKGIDISGNVGDSVISMIGGKVTKVAYDADGYGNYVIVENNGVSELFGHLSSVTVKVGDVISQSGKIGTVGSTGNVTGSHLHYEIRENGTAVNPLNFIENIKSGVTNGLSSLNPFNIDTGEIKQAFLTTSLVGVIIMIIIVASFMVLVPFSINDTIASIKKVKGVIS